MLRASNDAYGHMIMLMGVRIEDAFDRAQTHHPAQLSTDQRHHVIPALERLVVGVAVILLHNPTKLPPIDRLEEISKDAIRISHARPLSESRQPESTRFAPDWSGMLRGIVNHSPDGPALAGEGAEQSEASGESLRAFPMPASPQPHPSTLQPGSK